MSRLFLSFVLLSLTNADECQGDGCATQVNSMLQSSKKKAVSVEGGTASSLSQGGSLVQADDMDDDLDLANPRPAMDKICSRAKRFGSKEDCKETIQKVWDAIVEHSPQAYENIKNHRCSQQADEEKCHNDFDKAEKFLEDVANAAKTWKGGSLLQAADEQTTTETGAPCSGKKITSAEDCTTAVAALGFKIPMKKMILPNGPAGCVHRLQTEKTYWNLAGSEDKDSADYARVCAPQGGSLLQAADEQTTTETGASSLSQVDCAGLKITSAEDCQTAVRTLGFKLPMKKMIDLQAPAGCVHRLQTEDSNSWKTDQTYWNKASEDKGAERWTKGDSPEFARVCAPQAKTCLDVCAGFVGSNVINSDGQGPYCGIVTDLNQCPMSFWQGADGKYYQCYTHPYTGSCRLSLAIGCACEEGGSLVQADDMDDDLD